MSTSENELSVPVIKKLSFDFVIESVNQPRGHSTYLKMQCLKCGNDIAVIGLPTRLNEAECPHCHQKLTNTVRVS